MVTEPSRYVAQNYFRAPIECLERRLHLIGSGGYALIPSNGGANSAIRLQQFAYGGHNFEGGIGKTFPDKQSRAGLLYAAVADIVICNPAGVWPRIQPRLNLILCEICALQYPSAGVDPIRYRNQKGTRQRAHHLTGGSEAVAVGN